MFFKKRESFTSGAEVFHGISSSTINDIHAYLDETFDIVADELLDGGNTQFNIDDIPKEQIPEAVAEIQNIVGENFQVESVTASNEDVEINAIIISHK